MPLEAVSRAFRGLTARGIIKSRDRQHLKLSGLNDSFITIETVRASNSNRARRATCVRSGSTPAGICLHRREQTTFEDYNG
jgi:hypothetical protein